MATLVIVESPAKAKKIASLLGPGFIVEASLGHVRDLPSRKEDIPARYKSEPWANLGVHPDTFRPIYVVPDAKKRTVSALQALAKNADRVLFAADPDREGEAIAWHLAQLLGVKDPLRMVYTEITQRALQAALANTRPIDLALVAAQESRRVIDRLVGYRVSPLLWNAVGGKLSAGRVQSAALMLLAKREMARMKFRPATFWSIRADVLTRPTFTATVTHVKSKDFPEGRALAKASDYTSDGALKDGVDALELTSEQASALSAYLNGKDALVDTVDVTETRSRPAPPFTTSTLQQAGARLKLSAKEIMDVAQTLYESGFITYMRTDSPALSDEALAAARAEATRLFGAGSVPTSPRVYAARAKNAQEAHEAIRPSGDAFRAPSATGLSGVKLDVYTLIYQRTVASQMMDAVYDKTTVTLTCGAATLRATGRVQTSAGFTALLAEDDDDSGEQRLPNLTPGQTVPLKALAPDGKKTSAPARYTEATLVQAMEKAGIGRPSTYAQTLATLQTRAYVRLSGRALAVTATGLLVATYLARHVPEVARAEFTADMEAGLDDVARGDITRVAYLTRFWTEGLAPIIHRAADDAPNLPLPHLPGARLVVSRGTPALLRGGTRALLPAEVIPADLDEQSADAVLNASWKPKKARASKRDTDAPAKRASMRTPGADAPSRKAARRA